MNNYYTILGISETASEEEIKKAFRSKLKTHHPDIHFSKVKSKSKNKDLEQTQHDNLVDIINAYNMLSNPVKKKYYDERKNGFVYQDNSFTDEEIFSRRAKKSFNYEKFLHSRKHLWEYKVKLFVYDLVFIDGEHAIPIYEHIKKEGKISHLRQVLGYYDYFDCIFLVSEYYQNKIGLTNANKAITIFLEISEMELTRPYFKSYMEEVAERVFNINQIYQNELEVNIMHQLLVSMKKWILPTKMQKKISKLLGVS